jgi:ATP-dependent DNA helicase DinG
MGAMIGQESARRIAPDAAEAMRAEIRECGGREVFFAGTVDDKGLVRKVRPCARGTESAVPAILEALGTGDAVLHNHPSGGIAPSEADVQLASIFAHNGHGMFIVDNEVERVYVVVEPFLRTQRVPLDIPTLQQELSLSGRVAQGLAGFEFRRQQGEMLAAVAGAFNGDGIAVIEAPTGVGKTVAYLIPAVEWALTNRERVVISTRTINLQEQLIQKDIPLVRKCLDKEFGAVLVKGRQNYLCRRRLERAASEATLFQDDATQQALRQISEWAAKTEDGSLSDLPFVPPRALWDEVCSESDTCTGAQCQQVGRCFLTRARREVAKADLLVVNHHMLFADLAIKKEIGNFSTLAVLPAFKRLILDEAHNVEDSATEYFGLDATRNGALALLGRFVRRERVHERGLLPYLKMRLIREAPTLQKEHLERILDVIDNAVAPAVAASRQAIITAFAAVRSYVAEHCKEVGRDIKWRLTQEVLAESELRDIHNVYVLPAVEELRQCAAHCTTLHALLARVKPSPEQSESPVAMETVQIQGFRDRLNRLANALAEGTSAQLQPNTVRWIEIDANNDSVIRIARCPLEVGKPLAEWVYPALDTVVMTSATLSVRQRFDYFFKRVGLDRVEERPVETSILDSPFDFEKQALLCIPKDLPAPDAKAYPDASVEAIGEVLQITRGHAFVLFTSFYALNHAHKRLEAQLRAAGITPLRQGEATRTQLLQRFRSDTASVLFGTDSFWEGVDVAGEALQCVILPRLPFRVPTEPVLQARAEALEAAGTSAFMDYTVPQAVIKFRQGFGRLVRRASDRGAVVVLDSRILTKHYGRTFLDSLPGIKTVVGPRREVWAALSEFFDGPSGGENGCKS